MNQRRMPARSTEHSKFFSMANIRKLANSGITICRAPAVAVRAEAALANSMTRAWAAAFGTSPIMGGQELVDGVDSTRMAWAGMFLIASVCCAAARARVAVIRDAERGYNCTR